MTTPSTPPLSVTSEKPKVSEEPSDKKRELDLREREVKAREDEVKAKKQELDRSRWSNPLVLGMFAAAIGLGGNIWVEHANNKWAKDTEQTKAQSTLILEAIKTGDANKACQNLLFFVRLGLIHDNGSTIQRECASAPQGPPSLPTNEFFPQTGSISRMVVSENKSPIASVSVTVENAATGERVSATTNRDGYFVAIIIRSSPLDKLKIRFEKAGYDSSGVEIPSAYTRPIEVALHKSD